MEQFRERVQERLTRASRYPVTLVTGRAGFGKSVAVGHFLKTIEGAVVRYEVGEAQTSLMRFVRGFAAALEAQLPKVPQSLAIAHERAMQSPDAAAVLAAWVAEHLTGEPRTIAIDDYHHCEFDPAIAAFLSAAIDRTRANVRWIVTGRTLAELPLATWLARGDAELPVDEQTLALSRAEAERIAAALAPSVEPALIPALLEATSGSPGHFTFVLQSLAHEPDLVSAILDAAGDIDRWLIDRLLGSLTPFERGALVESALFPEASVEFFTAAGIEEAEVPLARVRAAMPHAFQCRDGRERYHPLVRERLAVLLTSSGAGVVRSANVRTAQALERLDRIAEALAFYVRGEAFEALADLIQRRGLALVEAGYGETIHEAIEALDPFAQTNRPVILAVKAMFDSRLGRFDTAESWYQLALDRATDAAVRHQIQYQYCTHLVRFFRPEAADLLERLAHDPGVESDLRAYALAALGPAYVFIRRLDDAAESVERALNLCAESRNAHLRARAHHQASYVALYSGRTQQAKTLAAHSLELATEYGYFDVAAGALTVLYNVAADLEDDPRESLNFLDAVADCAAKSGSLTNHLLALIAKLEIEVERGDEEAVAMLDERLRTLDVTCSGRAIYEALLPSKALRASWTGDFRGAYRLLATSAQQQWSADRKALRWAEVATYAAAAALPAEAKAAIRNALELLEGVEPQDLRGARARLFLALAAIVLGRGDSAGEFLAAVDAHPESLSPRLAALRRALGALRERYRGARNQSDLLVLFHELQQRDFGGVARLLMTLPLADNASLRLGDLSLNERQLLVGVALGQGFVNERRSASIVAKLGCVDLDAALRAVFRHPSLITTKTGEPATLLGGAYG